MVGGFGTLWTSVVLFGLAMITTAVTIPRHLSPSPQPQPYLRSVKEGLLYVLRDRTLRDVTLVAAVVWVFILPFETVVLNAHLQETGQVAAFGAILAAYAGGGIAGALGYGAIAHWLPTRPTLAAALALAGLSLGAFALLPSTAVMVGLALVAGIVTGPINPVCAVIIQSRTPERLRGRVIGSYTALALAAGPLGLLAFGPLVDAFGPAVGFALIGAGLCAGSRGGRPGPRAARAGPAGAGHRTAAGLRGAPGGRGLSALAGLTRPGQEKISSKNAAHRGPRPTLRDRVIRGPVLGRVGFRQGERVLCTAVADQLPVHLRRRPHGLLELDDLLVGNHGIGATGQHQDLRPDVRGTVC